MEVGGQHHIPIALPLGKSGPQDWSGWVWKISFPPWFNSLTSSLSASYYTNYSFLAHIFWLCCHKFPHKHFSQVMQHYGGVCNLQHEWARVLNGVCYCNCFTVISVIWTLLWVEFRVVLCLFQTLYLYISWPVEPLVIKHVISMAATTKTTIQCKLLSIQEELDILNTMDGT